MQGYYFSTGKKRLNISEINLTENLWVKPGKWELILKMKTLFYLLVVEIKWFDYFRLHIIFFLQKQATLMGKSTVLSLPLQLVFLGKSISCNFFTPLFLLYLVLFPNIIVHKKT